MLGAILGSAAKVAKGTWGLASGGPLKRGLLGAGIGGAIGAASGYDNANLQTESIAKGALLGGALGAIGFRRGSIGKFGFPVPAIGRMGTLTGVKGLGKDLLGASGRFAKNVGTRAAVFAAENPKTALGLGAITAAGVGAAVVAGNSFSPTLNPFLGTGPGGRINPAYTPEMGQYATMRMADNQQIGTGGVASGRAMNRNTTEFMNSTMGLTQGLHRGRHG
jgi:hypothetical protein